MKWLFLCLLFSLSSFADTELARSNAKRMIPDGQITEYHYYRTKTSKGTTVELYFDDAGVFRRAGGNQPENDELYIGKLGLNLADAFKLIQSKKVKINEWKLEEENGNWIYTFFEIRGPGDETIHKVDALKGKLLN